MGKALALFLSLGALVSCSPRDPAGPATDREKRPGVLSVASLNLAMEKDPQVVLRDIRAATPVRDADVLLFQEAVHSNGAEQGVPGEVARALHMQVVFAPAAPGVYDRGLAILSRYPLRDSHVRRLKVYNLRFHTRDRFALAATVETPAGRVRVWNVHLDTRINAQDRVEQLAPVVEEAAAVSGPKIIAGDFNTNDMRWIWNVLPVPDAGRQAGAVREYMARNGFRAPLQNGRVTFRQFGMHLDWVYEQGFQARAASVQEIPFSDHRALVVDLDPSGR